MQTLADATTKVKMSETKGSPALSRNRHAKLLKSLDEANSELPKLPASQDPSGPSTQQRLKDLKTSNPPPKDKAKEWTPNLDSKVCRHFKLKTIIV